MRSTRRTALLGAVGLLTMACPLLASSSAQAAQSGPCALRADTEAGPVDPDVVRPGTGTLKGIVVFVDFPEARATVSTDAQARWATEGVRERLLQLSHDRLDVQLTVHPGWYQMERSAASIGMEDEEGFTFEEHLAYFEDVIALTDDDVDYAPYDVVYFVAAPGTPSLPANHAATVPEGEGVVVDGKEIRAWVDLTNDDGPPGDLIPEHETLHTLGLPDLYAYDGEDTDRFIGGFDLMGGPVTQPELFAWHRWQLGWVEDAQVLCLPRSEEQELTLAPVTSAEDPVAFVVRTGPSTVLVGEYRTRDGLDAESCRTGLLLYTVDDRVGSGEGITKVVDSRPGSRPADCGHELDDAPFDLDVPRYGHPSGVGVEVLAKDDAGLRVRVTRSDPAPGLTVSPAAISAGQPVTATWTGRPGQVVEVLSRTQPATQFSRITTITLDSSGRATTTHRPQRNTRLTGRTAGTTATGVAPIIAVRSVASINVRRSGSTQVVTGRVYPALPGRLVSIYRDGRLLRQARCDASGIYAASMPLTGGSALQARTADDTYNLGTTSAVVR